MKLHTASALLIGIALAATQPVLAADALVTVTGEVIDSACYIKAGAKGEGHRGCTQKCADGGIPLALLEDGSGKVIWLASKEDGKTPNAELKPHAGHKVTIKGNYAERGGTKLLVIDSVTPVK
jgi:hypothetical protein